ncbi:LysR family transcriptional regulator [Homoserinimonas sp. OAct 916]|uniref:LysR family transcriptional regulator n=1 Tax=Homoserinimonas sp. OAct 916 TaxID=2211450 RepID=UPI000DBE2ACC|nr:LysR family transcriptional regulator [Homoserinimonas sp. OAct 916]
MDIRRLDLLRELAERGTITAVARATHRTPSAVSQQIKLLEKEVGAPLTQPAGRGISLTHAGRTLAASARDVRIAIEKASALWDEYANNPVGEVTMAIFPTAGEMLLPGALTTLAGAEGLVLLCDDVDPSIEVFADLANDYDVVLAHSPKGTSTWAGRGLTQVPLMVEPLDVVLPLGHRLAGRTTIAPKDLIGESWIGMPVGYPTSRLLLELEAYTRQPVTVVQRFSNTRVIEALVLAGHGIALLPRFTTVNPGLAVKELSGIESERHIVALMRPDRAERLSVRKVIAALSNEAERIPLVHEHPKTQPIDVIT